MHDRTCGATAKRPMTIAPSKCGTQVRHPSAAPKCVTQVRPLCSSWWRVHRLRLPAHEATLLFRDFCSLFGLIPSVIRPQRCPRRTAPSPAESARPRPVQDMSEKPASAYLKSLSRSLDQGGRPNGASAIAPLLRLAAQWAKLSRRSLPPCPAGAGLITTANAVVTWRQSLAKHIETVRHPRPSADAAPKLIYHLNCR